MSQPTYGRIINYRIGIRAQLSHECLVQFPKEAYAAQAGQFIGRKVVWKGEKKMLYGRIVGFHGRNGIVRAAFKKGVPGQAIGTVVELVA